MNKESEKLMILRPLGPQGPKIGVGVSSKEEVKRLDKEVGKLPESQRNTVEGLTKAIRNAELSVIKP
jgi:hypothetical protein